MALTKDYNHARRMGFKFPKQMCKPAKSAGVFILDTAVMCAIEAIIPGAGKIADAVKLGKKVADKLGVMGKINAMKKKAESFVVGKFLGIFGCKVRRELFGFKNIAKGISHAAHSVAKKASNAAKSVAKKAKTVAKDAAKVAGKAVKVAAAGAKFVAKNWGAIAKVICPVIKPMCNPACGAALTAFKAAGTALAATFHIPLGCLSKALESGCHAMCKAVCGRRRLFVKKDCKGHCE